VMRLGSQPGCLPGESGSIPLRGASGRSAGRNAVSKSAEPGSIPGRPATDVDAQQRSRIATPRVPVRLRPTSPALSPSGGPRRDPPKVVDRVRLAAGRLLFTTTGQVRAGCAADATNVRAVGFDSHLGLCGAAGDGSQVSYARPTGRDSPARNTQRDRAIRLVP